MKIYMSPIYLLLTMTLGLNSCVIQYKPSVSLPIQKYSFKKNFKFDSFSDLRPASDSLLEKGTFSYKSISPSKKDYQSNLSEDFKIAISKGFKSTKFVQISEDNVYDYKINGEILHFYVKQGLTRFGFYSSITYFGAILHIFGIPTVKEIAEVQIKFNVFTDRNILLGTYLGEYKKKRKRGYWNYGNFLNDYLSLSVIDIQSQMIADSLKYR